MLIDASRRCETLTGAQQGHPYPSPGGA
jgi:hypothetical protein